MVRSHSSRTRSTPNDLARVKNLMTRDPALHRAPLGYGKNGPLTWVAECRVPWEPPTRARLAMAKWMIENGSDVHQGGDVPLMRAALNDNRIPMMELLVSYGADVNAACSGNFPIIFAPCESLDAEALKWLVDRGAKPNCHARAGTALDYLIGGPSAIRSDSAPASMCYSPQAARHGTTAGRTGSAPAAAPSPRGAARCGSRARAPPIS